MTWRMHDAIRVPILHLQGQCIVHGQVSYIHIAIDGIHIIYTHEQNYFNINITSCESNDGVAACGDSFWSRGTLITSTDIILQYYGHIR